MTVSVGEDIITHFDILREQQITQGGGDWCRAALLIYLRHLFMDLFIFLAVDFAKEDKYIHYVFTL